MVEKDVGLRLGIDIGSVTAKVVLTRGDEIIFEKYRRHFSKVREKTASLLADAEKVAGNEQVAVAISGSAGLGLAQAAGIPFVQEVFAEGEVVRTREPDTSCVIELGGEDAKIIFFDNGIDERMNGSCAGGTGAFIDQMATLLNVTADELDELSLKHEKIYPIASRCGVFAKTDIQPLLNQGAKREDVAASIYQAVVNQTIAGLARGKRITGKVLFLGGPLYFCRGLRERFIETLELSPENAVFPDYGRMSVAVGASIYAGKQNVRFTLSEVIERINSAQIDNSSDERLDPLFNSREEFDEFIGRHGRDAVPTRSIEKYKGRAYLGIDCGSTTTKLVLISTDNEILYSYYASNLGNPVEIVRGELKKLFELCGDRVRICGSAVTGYGEELIKRAFSVDIGVVETVAHFTAAKFFRPDVDFILDIGGQDMKCFKIRNGAIDSILLNEACSSGCGSFIETFARAMGYTAEKFAELGVFGKAPVNLGSRCTVFMNSSVKQSQKDGAGVEDISAGLSISIVKNAVYKVIRASDIDELGENIVVQGGTFKNNAVLRAFERELGRNVIRPSASELMGAYGAAIYSKKCKESTLIAPDMLDRFCHTSKATVCKGCENHCHLTINSFGDGEKYISGNRCERALGNTESEKLPNLYKFKRDYLTSLKGGSVTRPEKIGIPLALGAYELLPLWHGIFAALGFDVEVSPMSTRSTYSLGQFSIPSDTACYPAKLMHGHILELIRDGADAIFAPCLTYNIKEKGIDNNYNCPIVAYYSELLRSNMDELAEVKFLYPFLNINNRRELARELTLCLGEHFDGIRASAVRRAVDAGFDAYERYMDAVRREGERTIEYARAKGLRVMILAGRPYHIDSEIGHGIDELANSYGFCVVSEDSVSHLVPAEPVNVLNQWTYHSRLYRAARYAVEHKDCQLVQLVSFGCGVDAITSDEVRAILERGGKLYTQIKIDEITNLGAVRIRLRSLIGALEERE